MGTEARDRLKAFIESTKDFNGCVFIPHHLHIAAMVEEMEEDPHWWERQEWNARLRERKYGDGSNNGRHRRGGGR